MKKIPVGQTITRAYSFAFRDFFTVLGLTWVPWAFVEGISYSFQMTTLDLQTASPLSKLGFASLMVATFLSIAIQAVAICRQVLSLRTGPAYFYITLGIRVWRLLIAYILMTIAIVISAIVLIVFYFFLWRLVSLMMDTNSTMEKSIGAVIGIVLVILAPLLFCALVYFGVRLSFLMTPASVAENSFGVERAWNLGRGQFWRMFAIICSTSIPILIGLFSLEFIFLFHNFPGAEASSDQMRAWQANVSDFLIQKWYFVLPASLVLSTLMVGLVFGGQAFAYRALTEDDSVIEAF